MKTTQSAKSRKSKTSSDRSRAESRPAQARRKPAAGQRSAGRADENDDAKEPRYGRKNTDGSASKFYRVEGKSGPSERNGARRGRGEVGDGEQGSVLSASAIDTALPEEAAELLYQALETEMGGVEVYRTALGCVQNSGLRKEWQKYFKQTENHVHELREVCIAYGLDPKAETPGRMVVRHIGKSLVQAMEMALGSGNRAAAELVAAECVVLAETKDHLNWELLSKLSEGADDQAGELLAAACEVIEEEEDEHLYHTAGWTRELWLKSLGLPARLPPPEEEEDVTSAAEAERARKKSEKSRKT